jgi:hypothetical protein
MMIASGTPEEVASGASQSGSHTGRFLAEILEAGSARPSTGRSHAAPSKRRAKVAA